MKNLGNPQVTTELKKTIIAGVTHEAGNRSVKQLAKEENEMLLDLINLRTKGASESISTKKDDKM
jgi:carnitine 3-dehydrogenase